MKFIKTLGFKVFSDDLSLILIEKNDDKKCKVVNTISPNSYGISVKDAVFRTALKKSDYLVLDGVYFALSSILLQGKNIKRNQGPDVFNHFFERLDKISGKAFFLGSTQDTLNLIKSRAKREYPNITVETYSPPFKPEFSDEDNSLMIDKINLFNPDILFVGMTCPKQEKWSVKHRNQINSNLIICIGNVFDWYAGTQKIIRPIWFKLRIGWLVRIFQRPEIFRRNIKNQMTFFWHLFLIIIKMKKND